ncbi:MAG: exo-alpha-sialidase [Ruminococcaceae bacterium]|nr:exo-alpha-sialidase [Oscillospiraceae bacterium]
MKKRISFVALLALLLGSVGAAAMPLSAESVTDGFYHGKMTVTPLWGATSDDGKYTNHRIPGVVVTKKDTVIVYCEARTRDTSHSLKDAGDWALMDIYIQRSEDGGKTFGDPIYMDKGDDLRACVNNPVMIVGNDNTLHMLYCKNYSLYGGGLWYRRSTDDGLTWSEPRNVYSSASAKVKFDCFAFGPTHGICTRDGVLMSPVWLVLEGTGSEGNKTDHGPALGYVFYSKDNGETWQLSDRTAQTGGEMCIAELSDGSIYLNARATGYRKVTVSPNGINGWQTTYADEQLPDPSCCGGMVTVDLPGLPYAHLFVNCASPEKEDRTKVKLRVSFDDCVTWEKSVMLSEYEGGYCDVAVDSKGKIYVLYEVSYGLRMRMVTLSFVDEFLSDATPQRLANVNEFSFADGAESPFVSKLNHLDGSTVDEALRLTANQSKKHSVTFDFTSVTQNLNLTKKSAAVIRMRLNTQAGGDMVLGVYTVSGRVRGSAQEDYGRFNVAADGEWHDVVVNFEDFGAAGMLKSLQLEMFSDTLRGAVGDTMDVASIRFFDTAADAYAAVGQTDPNNPATQEPPTDTLPDSTDSQPPVTEEEGCGSAVEGVLPLLASATASALLLKRRKKANKKW